LISGIIKYKLFEGGLCPQKENIMKKYRDTFFALVFTLGFILLAELLVVNWALNCQTWDKSYWDETNSCFTIPQLFGWQ